MAFVLQDVIEELEEPRSLAPLKKLKRENLVKVALHFGITPAAGATKPHNIDLIQEYCNENNLIDELEESQLWKLWKLLKGYWQVPLTQTAHEISAFVTPSGLYQYKIIRLE